MFCHKIPETVQEDVSKVKYVNDQSSHCIASEMTYIVSSGALNSTHSLTAKGISVKQVLNTSTHLTFAPQYIFF